MSTRGASGCVPRTPTGLPALHEQRLVVARASRRLATMRSEALPVARGLAGPAVDDEVLRPLGDLGVEVVHEHAQGGLLHPALARAGGAPRRADRLHRSTSGPEASPVIAPAAPPKTGRRARSPGTRVWFTLPRPPHERPALHLRPAAPPEERRSPALAGALTRWRAPAPVRLAAMKAFAAPLRDRPLRVPGPRGLPDVRRVLRPAAPARAAPHRPRRDGRGLAGRRRRVRDGRRGGRAARAGEGDRLLRRARSSPTRRWRGGFEGGAYATIYLSPRDYHRIHFPLGGAIIGWRYVPGQLWPVNPASVRSVPGLFTVNERLVTMLDTPLGACAVVAVGATVVGRVRAFYDPTVPRDEPAGGAAAGARLRDAHPGREGAGARRLRDGLDRHPALRAGARAPRRAPRARRAACASGSRSAGRGVGPSTRPSRTRARAGRARLLW